MSQYQGDHCLQEVDSLVLPGHGLDQVEDVLREVIEQHQDGLLRFDERLHKHDQVLEDVLVDGVLL